MADKKTYADDIKDGEHQKSDLVNLTEILTNTSAEDERKLKVLTNISKIQVNPLSLLEIVRKLTDICFGYVNEYEKWLTSERQIGAYKFKREGARITDSETVKNYKDGLIIAWLQDYLIYRRALEGDTAGALVELAKTQLESQNKDEFGSGLPGMRQ